MREVFKTTDNRQWYRGVYLKSDHWKELRESARRTMAAKNKCWICDAENVRTDPHHINYKNLFDVEPSDILFVCRSCHDKIHVILKFASSWRFFSNLKFGQAIRRFRIIIRPETWILDKIEHWTNQQKKWSEYPTKSKEIQERLAMLNTRLEIRREFFRKYPKAQKLLC